LSQRLERTFTACVKHQNNSTRPIINRTSNSLQTMGCLFGKSKQPEEHEAVPDETYKVVLVGEPDVGKSSLLRRFTADTFDNLEAKEVQSKRVSVDNGKGRKKDVYISVFDTQGQEKFKTITSSFYDGSSGIILVFDTSCKSSFQSLRQNWFLECERYANDATLFLVGNKLDLEAERQVSKEELQNLAHEKGIGYAEVSAKTGTGVNEAFERLVQTMLNTDRYGDSINEDDDIKKKKKKKKGEDSDMSGVDS